MNDSAVVYMILILAIVLGLAVGPILMVISKRFFAFKHVPKNNQNSLYYKIDLIQKKITTIKFHDLKKDTSNLFDQDYELIRLGKLKAFIDHKMELPEKSFLVVFNNSFTYVFTKALPVLRNKQIDLIIFIPYSSLPAIINTRTYKDSFSIIFFSKSLKINRQHPTK